MFEVILDHLMYAAIYGSLGGSAGLLLGWNKLSQPELIKKIYDKIFN